jgi:hypothetical protein
MILAAVLATGLGLLMPMVGIVHRQFTEIVFLRDGAVGVLVVADLLVTTLFLIAASTGAPGPIRVLAWPFLVVSLVLFATVLLMTWGVLADAGRLYGAGLAALTVSLAARVPVVAALRRWWRAGVGTTTGTRTGTMTGTTTGGAARG